MTVFKELDSYPFGKSQTSLDAADEPAHQQNVFEKVASGIPIVLMQNNLAGGIEADMAHSDGTDGFPLLELIEPGVHGLDAPGALYHIILSFFSLRRKGDRVASDQRVLSRGEFV